jgi:glycosyltransferase involved in cell wall biosynthesis
VADFGDAWAFDEMIVYPSAAHRALERRRMQKVLAAASVVVTSTDEAAARFRALLGPDGPRSLTIPNGFEADDFASPAPARDPEVFRIVHTGFLHTGLGERYLRFGTLRQLLRGGVDGVDVLARSHVFLVEALRRLLARRPDLEHRVELHLIGAASDADERIAGGNDFIKMTGYVPHERAVAALRSADLLFLPMHDLADGARATLVPGKTYEYLASGTPILAAVPAGDARELLERAGNATICAPKDVAAMADAVEQHIGRKMGGGDVPRPRRDVVAEYEYRRLARRLADALDEAVALRASGGR